MAAALCLPPALPSLHCSRLCVPLANKSTSNTRATGHHHHHQRRHHPASSSFRDWNTADLVSAQKKTYSKCQIDPRNGWLYWSSYGSWKLSLSPVGATKARVSEKEENVASDDAGNANGNDISISNTSPKSKDLGLLSSGQAISSLGESEVPVVSEESAISEAVKTVLFWVSAAISFGIFILLRDGTGKASEFFAGYLLEQSLSVDNLFVFVVVFKYFRVPLGYQTRILTYGIAGAVVFRATMILLGVATIQSFEAVNLLFAGILIFASYKLLTEGEDDGDDDLSNNFIVNTCRKFIPVTAHYDGEKFFSTMEGPLKATPLFLTLAIIELSDVVFAIDSIPAVFGVTRDPFIVFSSNIFAILGLRSLYILVSTSMNELEYLQPSVALVLGFIGSKMISDYLGFHISTEISLGVVASVLGLGIGLSVWKNKNNDE